MARPSAEAAALAAQLATMRADPALREEANAPIDDIAAAGDPAASPSN